MGTDPSTKGTDEQVSLSVLFLTFLKVGLFSFGGGLSGWIYQEVVVRRRWLTANDFLAGLTIAQILPGANVTNVTVYIGNRVRGMAGAAVAVAAILVGPAVLVVAMAEALSWLSQFAGLNDFLDGMAAAAIGLLLVVGLQAARAAVSDWGAGLTFAAVFVAIGFLGSPLVLTVLIVGGMSIGLAWLRRANV